MLTLSPLDPHPAQQAVTHYSKACGMGCRVIDQAGDACCWASPDQHKPQPCLCELAGQAEQAACHAAHLNGAYQAERLGGRYVYFCPMGLTFWASPIVRQSQVIGTLIAGPVHLVDPDDLGLDDIMARLPTDTISRDRLAAQIRAIPVVPGDRVNSLSELLLLVAAGLSDKTFDQLEQNRKNGALEAELWQQIDFLKRYAYVDQEQLSYPLEKEELLLEKIASGDKDAASQILNEILGHIFFSSSGNLDTMRARVVELVVLLSRAAIRGGADVEQIFGLNYTYLGKIYAFRTIDEIAFWLSGIMARFTDQVFNLSEIKHADVIYRACDYVRKNYMNKLTLEETAAFVYLSPAYFSRIFKDEMGLNFSTYLNQYRVEAARKRLLNDTASLSEIAVAVGFEGQSYFSKVFKKMTGVTPGKYRESRGLARTPED